MYFRDFHTLWGGRRRYTRKYATWKCYRRAKCWVGGEEEYDLVRLLFRFLPGPASVFRGLQGHRPILLRLLLRVMAISGLFLRAVIRCLRVQQAMVANGLLTGTAIRRSILGDGSRYVITLRIVRRDLIRAHSMTEVSGHNVRSFLFLRPNDRNFTRLVRETRSRCNSLLSAVKRLVAIRHLTMVLLQFCVPTSGPVNQRTGNGQVFHLASTPLRRYRVLLAADEYRVGRVQGVASSQGVGGAGVNGVVRAQWTSPRSGGRYEVVISTGVLKRLIMNTLSGNTMSPRCQFSASNDGNEDRNGDLLFNGTRVSRLPPYLLATLQYGTGCHEYAYNSTRRDQIFLRLLRRVANNGINVIFALSELANRVTNFGIRQGAMVRAFFLLFYRFMSLAFRNVSVCRGQVLLILRFARDLCRLLRIVTVLRVRVVVSRYLGVITKDLPLHFTWLLRVTM